jgi:hypothetical protein
MALIKNTPRCGPVSNATCVATAFLAVASVAGYAETAADNSQAAAAAAAAPTSSLQIYGLTGMYIDSSKLSTSRASTVREGGGLTTSF